MNAKELDEILGNPVRVAELKANRELLERLFKQAKMCAKHSDFSAESCPSCLAVGGEAVSVCGPLHEVVEKFRRVDLPLGFELKIFGHMPGEVHVETLNHAPPLKPFLKLGAVILGGALLWQGGRLVFQILMQGRSGGGEPKRTPRKS